MSRHRDVTVLADGRPDRSPCGSGAAARVALLADAGSRAPGTNRSTRRWWVPSSVPGSSGRPRWPVRCEGRHRGPRQHRARNAADRRHPSAGWGAPASVA
ncbi:proline racemase family protein [Streptomyces sp. V2I9]|uniref:proline racemase family protein n=1 Tax=Streptomyces sp. V2I9 TaxID=3042304 RepID=UPI0027D8FAF0|nr:proline racemase family protein [Streptomyces sp. V2I9]